jgi:threonine synthase
VPPERLRAIVDAAYGPQWHHADITPVLPVAPGLHSLHLGHGPTFAFKNVALEFLPRILSELVGDRTIHVLGASSGDTINAAHSGVKGTNIRSLFMLPSTGPSQVQRLQAVNGIVDNPNAVTLLADQPFDPLQAIVKRINGPEFQEFKQEHGITSFNSINIARILAQVVYYFRAYTQLLREQHISNGDEIVFSVPSGNFGDALAGYYARKMGLPISKIVVATNENDMLRRFFETGIYEPPKRDGKNFVQITNAPSMDIAVSSNFERMLFDICGLDSVRIKGFYDELAATGKFSVDAETLAEIRKIFVSSASTDTERMRAISDFGRDYAHGIDPHTAAGVVPWLRDDHDLRGQTVVFLETSHVAQFASELRAQGLLVPGMDKFDATLDAMRAAQPRPGIDFLQVSGDFQETLNAVNHAIAHAFVQK